MPETNGTERADIATRFKPGNKAAVGHGGGAGHAARLREAARSIVSETDMAEMMQAQIGAALKGDTVAAKFVFDYCGCKPVEAFEIVERTLLDVRLQAALIHVPDSEAEGQ